MNCVKKILILIGVSCAMFGRADEPSMYVSFDKTVQADYGGTGFDTKSVAGLQSAVGVKPQLLVKNGKEMKKPDPDFMLMPGLSGKAFPIGKASDGRIYTLEYPIKPNLSSAEGTVSFWFKPLDWDGTEKAFFRHLFSAKNGNDWFFIYKNSDSYDLLGLYGTYKQKNETIAKSSIKSWEKGEWHNIVVSWNSKALSLYVDGKQKSIVPMKSLLKQNFLSILLGEHWSGDPGQTLIDELRIFDKALPDAEIIKEYARMSDKLPASKYADLVAAVGKKTPVTDGKIDGMEYSSVIGGMRDIHKRNVYANRQSKCYFAWDDKNFYFAMSSPLGKPVISQNGRDSAVYTDDSIELYIKSPDALYQFISNPVGTIYDSKDGNVSWNSNGFVAKSSHDGKTWIIEGSIPWSDLGIKPSTNMHLPINIARNFADTKTFTQLSPSKRGYGEHRFFAVMTLKDNPVFYDVSELGALYNSTTDCIIQAVSAQNKKLAIRLDVDAPMFSVNIKQQFQLEANQKFKHRIKRRIPTDNTLVYSLSIPEDNTVLYSTKLDYRSLDNMNMWYIRTDLKKQELIFVFRNSRLNEGKNSMELDLVAADGQKAMTKTVKIPDDKPVAEAVFPLAGIPAGRYQMKYQLADPNGKVFYSDTEEYEYFKNGAPWDGITDGSEDTLPSPWTPVNGKGDLFSCWGRKVKLGGKGLVSSVISQNIELLNCPVILNFNGQSVEFKANCISSKPTAAEFRLTPVNKEIPLSFTVKCEFDGFMYFTGSVKPGVTVEKLSVEIPLDRAYADAFDDCASCHYKTSLKEKNMFFHVNTVRNPFFWCGGDQIGIMGGSATKRGWHIRNKAESMSVKVSDSNVLLTIHIADTGFTPKNGETFSFYLHPTPVKPLNKDTMEAHERNNVIIGGASSRFYEYHQPDYFTDFWKWIEIRVEQDKRISPEKMKYFPYLAPKGVSPMSPAWNYYCTDWVNPAPGLGEYSADNPAIEQRKMRNISAFTWGCLNSKSFFDHKISCAKYVLDGKKYGQKDVTNLYFDLGWPRTCNNSLHGCAWNDEFGDVHNDNDLLRLREYYVRVYRMMKKKDPSGLFWGHQFTARTPCDSFFDFLIMGEMYDAKVYKSKTYYDVLTPELMRITYGTRTNEMNVSLREQFLRSLECFAPEEVRTWDPFTPENDKAVRHFIAYGTIYGLVQTWDIWLKGQRLPPIGTGQVDIWHKTMSILGKERKYRRECAMEPDKDRILACTYTGNGKMLLVALNDTTSTEKIKIHIPSSEMKHFSNASGTEIYKQSQCQVKNGTLSIELESRDSAFILFE